MDKPFKSYTLERFPLEKAKNKAAIICPFWADVDLNNGGDLWSRETTDPVLLHIASSEGECFFSTSSKSIRWIKINNNYFSQTIH